jgi:ferredoxin-nitrite reductase
MHFTSGAKVPGMESTSTHSGTFTADQKEYLAGFFTGVARQGLRPFAGITSTGLISSDPACGAPNLAAEAEDSYHGIPLSDLCREELWKAEQNPLDIWDRLLASAKSNESPTPEDTFRFKFHGLFYVAPAQDSFMLRLRIPGGRLTAHQMRGLAELAERYGSGRCDLTTRANMQIREFQPRDIIRVLNTVQSLGLTSRGTGADNVRNITASPATGLDPNELLDVGPITEGLHHYILNSRDLYELPRKFNVAFDSGGSISVLADTNDIGFQAVRILERRSVPPGIYFRVLLCGITGHRQFARDTGLLVPPEQAVAVAAAMIRVFVDHGDRSDRKKARLKYLVDRWGVEKFIAETEKRLAIPLLRCSATECEPRNAIDRSGHIGIHPQFQPDLNYIGVSVPVGRLPVDQMRLVARIAEEFGTGEIRLTVWQNLLIPNVHSACAAEAIERLRDGGLHCDAGTVLRGTVACTGNRGCRYAATDTKTHAVEIAKFLDSRLKILQPVNLHVTGCPHSCAQHYIGDIGLLGTRVMGAEGYQVFVGGGADNDQGLARELFSSVSYADLPPLLQALLQAYLDRRHADEPFLDFTRRHSIDQLKSFLAFREAAAQ